MKTQLKQIMINKGDVITCLHNLTVNGTQYFTEGCKYESPQDNCLVDDYGTECFVSQQFLPYFFD